jgi:hypothetical protein
MIDFHSELISALNTVLPSHHELALTSKEKTPCISYQERNNADAETGDTLGYSRISFTVKVWRTSIADLQKYSLEIDKVLRPIGFKRISSGELADRNSLLKQKILTYEALASENY